MNRIFNVIYRQYFNFGRVNELNTSKISNLMPTTYYYYFNKKFSSYNSETTFRVITIAERILESFYFQLLVCQNGNNFTANLDSLKCLYGIEIYVPVKMSNAETLWTTVRTNFAAFQNLFRMLYTVLVMPQLPTNVQRKRLLHTNDQLLHTNDYL